MRHLAVQQDGRGSCLADRHGLLRMPEFLPYMRPLLAPPSGPTHLYFLHSGNNVRIECNRMAVQNVSGAAHSERLGHDLITAGRNTGLQLNVTEIYTEYNPCADSCLPLIRRYYPTVRVTFSFIWELWGRQTPDRNAAVEAMFNAQENR